MKLSIIVPVYNVEAYLDKCLDSLVNQTMKDYEIIIVNDGSTDNSEDIIFKYKEKYEDLIKYISIPNNGVGNARNVGITLAKGEYITFLDSDDYVDINAYKTLYEKIIDGYDMVMSGYYIVRNNKLIKKSCKEIEFEDSIINKPEMIYDTLPYCWAYMYKKELIESNNIKFSDHKIFEDLLFTYKCIKCAKKIGKVNAPLIYYVDRSDSVTFKFTNKFFSIFEVIDELDKYYDNCIDKKYITFLALRHTFIRFNTKVSIKDNKIKKEFIDKTFKYLNNKDSNWKSNYFFKKGYKKYYDTKIYWILKTYIKGRKK